jgi:fructokinase
MVKSDMTIYSLTYGEVNCLSVKDIDVTALGELLIDMTPHGISSQGNALLEANPGGAPCNALAMVSRLGGKTAFIGKVGNDQFGSLLKKTIEDLGIDSRGLIMDPKYSTTIAFVHLDNKGERSFSFCRKPGADMMLTSREVSQSLITRSKIFHFGTVSLTNEPVESATKYAVETARENGCMISFDPNIRLKLWDSEDHAKEQMMYGLGKCHVLKISDDEIQMSAGTDDIDEAAAKIRSKFPNIKLMFVTLGKDGSLYYYDNLTKHIPAFVQCRATDTTGAGDAFMGSCLYYLSRYGIDNLNEKLLDRIVRFANAAASIVITRKGALKVMPGREEVEKIFKPR